MALPKIDEMSPPAIPTLAALKYPKAIQKLNDDYETAFSAWADADTELAVAREEYREAVVLDAKALTEAVAQGLPDPGEKNTYEAERKILYAVEKCNQTRRVANAKAKLVNDALIANRDVIVALAVAKAREGVEKWRAEVTKSRESLDRAHALRNESLDGLKMLSTSLRGKVSFDGNFPVSGLVSFPNTAESRILNICDMLENGLDGELSENELSETA